MGVHRMPVDPDAGIPDLVRRLGDDSKRLMKDEVRLAKLELHESVHEGGRGAMFLGISFGIGVLAAVSLTLFLVTLIGRFAGGHMWIGALITGVAELAVGALVIKRGMAVLGEPSYSFEQTRTALKR